MWCDIVSRPAEVSRQHGFLPSNAACSYSRTCRVSVHLASALRASLLILFARDTRVLLTSTDAGRVTPLTENHHAEARVESQRLRRMMGGLTTDSFGEVR